MAINTNDGTGLKDLPVLPQIPANVGKLDVGAIYDRVAQAANTSAGLATQGSDMIARTSALATQLAKNRQARQVIPSETQADIATNTATAANAPLGTVIKQSEADKAQQTTPSSIAATISANDAADTQNQVNKIYADANLQVAPTIANDTAQLQSGLYKRLKDSGQGMVTAPLTGPGGQPLGTMLVYTSPDGTPKTQVVPVPYGQLSRINTGVEYIPLGHKIDPASNQPTAMQYQAVYPNAAGGITKGEIIPIGLNDPPPGQIYMAPGSRFAPQQAALAQPAAPASAGAPAQGAPGAAPLGQPAAPAAAAPAASASGSTTAPLAAPSAAPAAAPTGGRIAAQVAAKNTEDLNKQRMEFLEDLPAQAAKFDSADAALDQLRKDLDTQKQSTILNGSAARLTGIAAHTPAGQQVDSDVSHFISGVMEGAKNIRTQQEFNAYSGGVPKANQYDNVQDANYAYMRNANNVMRQRVQFMQDQAKANPNFNPSQLQAEAVARFPLASGSAAPTPAAAPAPAAAAAPAPAPAAVTPGATAPNPAAIAYLKANPSMAAQFDAKYGQGEAAKILAAPTQ